MPARHTAYGLDLRCTFPLPGMPERAPDAAGGGGLPASANGGLPGLTVELLGAEELEDAWSGSEGPPEWTGQLGDGCSLSIEQGNGGDVLFTYADRARFRLARSRERLECAPLRGGLHWQQVLLGRILPNVAIMRGYEALHASAVDSPEGVLAVAAPSGMGKTTLARELMRRGWPLFADDALILGAGPAGVLAHPGTPHMNVLEDTADPTGGSYTEPRAVEATTLGILGGERWIAVAQTAREPRPVRMICLFERNPGLSLEERLLPASPLPLAPYMLGLRGGPERERRRFARYADLMSCAALLRLTCDTNASPGDLADRIEQALTDAPMLIEGAVA
jgi:hypothetical protein